MAIKDFIEKEKTLFNNLITEGQQMQENYIKMKTNLIIKQKNYNNSLKDFYNFITNIDENDLKSLLDNDNTSKDLNSDSEIGLIKKTSTTNPSVKVRNLMNDDNKDIKDNKDNKENKDNKVSKQMAKKGKIIEKININKIEYISTLNEANEYLKDYRKKFENVLQNLEDQYRSLLKIIQTTLFSMVDDKRKVLNKLTELYDNLLHEKLNINVEDEIIEFITRNATKEFPINKFEFISSKFENTKNSFDINNYIKENFEKEENKIQMPKRGKSRKKKETRNFRKRSIKKRNTGDKNENTLILLENNSIADDIRKYKISLNISLIEDFIDELINNKEEEEKNNLDNIYNDSSSKMIDISNIKSLIDVQNNDNFVYIENLFKFLNNHRARGNFLINKKSHEAFIEIFNYLIDNYSTSDFILKNIIILAQTFYTLDSENNDLLNLTPSKKKIFIQTGLKNNMIFNKEEIWHRVINYTLANTVFNKDITQPVDKNEVNNKLKLLAYNTLIAYLCDLKYFTDDEKVFNDLKNYYVRIYQLDGDALNKEINGILNYEPSKPKNKRISFKMKTRGKKDTGIKKTEKPKEN